MHIQKASMDSSKYPLFIQHPFWKEMGNNSDQIVVIVEMLASMQSEEKASEFLLSAVSLRACYINLPFRQIWYESVKPKRCKGGTYEKAVKLMST